MVGVDRRVSHDREALPPDMARMVSTMASWKPVWRFVTPNCLIAEQLSPWTREAPADLLHSAHTERSGKNG